MSGRPKSGIVTISETHRFRASQPKLSARKLIKGLQLATLTVNDLMTICHHALDKGTFEPAIKEEIEEALSIVKERL